MTPKTFLEQLQILVNDSSLHSDYQKATKRNVRAAALRVRRKLQGIKEHAQEMRGEMLAIIHRPDPEGDRKKLRIALETQLEIIKQQLTALERENRDIV